MKCMNCGEKLTFRKRSDAKFCDANCRKRYSRRGDAAKKGTRNIMRDLQTVRLTIKKHSDLREELNERLKRLRDEITDILRLSDSGTIQEEGEKAQFLTGYRSRR